MDPTLTINFTRMSMRRRSTGGSQSGSDHEGSREVPTVDYVLDNSVSVEQFKRDVLALAHRLKVIRWRSVPISEYGQLKITRISGALTNAVYCVSPPPKYSHHARDIRISMDPLDKSRTATIVHVPRILLRVYGPNSSQIIDRASELAVLKRLSSRNIGPRIFGIFTNGRFEQFLKATTLTKEDIRTQDTSIIIAKRMRELHDGVELTFEERMGGPGVWRNYDKWSVDAKRVLSHLDTIEGSKWNTRKVLGTSFERFQSTVQRYKDWLFEDVGGPDVVNNELVFAHNDAQYGNLLRVDPPSGSPLLRPAHEHKTLVVIDFEYASPNVRGYDIANHFCEWMSDYHDPIRPQDIHSECFPTQHQQLKFVESYVTHGLENFDDILKIDRDIHTLHHEATVWRAAVHIGWAMWGIISAPVPEEDKEDAEGFVDEPDLEEKKDLQVEPFDYLDYASQKAALFWGEMKTLGISVPEDVDLNRAMHVNKRWSYLL
ncbi:kinase-like domain-containing protein [Lipomyces arxii]|uniref:kinase-like domain-containing protein n=1 Tax=Lipomyces arxii TaxID=56418 RepID=UPI0034CF8E14